MKNLPVLALICIFMGCASAPPVASGIAGTYDLVSVDGGPLPSVDGIVDGTLELRGNRTFTWRFTMLEVDEGGNRSLAPIVFEGRFAVDGEDGTGLRILLTRRDRASSLSGSEEEIEGALTGGTLTFTAPELNAVFRRRE